MKGSTTAAGIGYSYVRFSTPEQRNGDSLHRQTEAARAWCEKKKVRLDTSVTLHDLGKSAYLGDHRKNPDRHALAAFLKMVEGGKIPRGSYLIIEALDRLTREHVRAGLMLLLGLIENGIRVVQLSPSEVVYDDTSDEMGLMLAIVELSRGHKESKRKSDLVGAAWAEKKKRARQGLCQKPTAAMGEGRRFLTRWLPAWVEERGGELRIIPDRARTVKRIFELAAAGYGLARVVKKLTKEKVPPFGTSDHWNTSYVGAILRDRRALGEYTPGTRGNRRSQEPIPDYFPAAVTEKEWLRARAGAAERKRMPGRVQDHLNIFAGLLKNARDGESYFSILRNDEGGRRHVLINITATQGRGPCHSFPLPTFERAFLKELAEIDPREILPTEGPPDETLTLAAELAAVESRIADLEAELLNGDVSALARVLRQLEVRKTDLAGQLARAREKAAHPLSETWGETRTLLAALDAAPDPADARVRLRSALRRIVSEVWLLVVPRGRDRLCALQVRFAGGDRVRNYLIMHGSPRGNAQRRRAGQWWVKSFARAAVPGGLDLRDRGHVSQLEKVLQSVDLTDGPSCAL